MEYFMMFAAEKDVSAGMAEICTNTHSYTLKKKSERVVWMKKEITYANGFAGESGEFISFERLTKEEQEEISRQLSMRFFHCFGLEAEFETGRDSV